MKNIFSKFKDELLDRAEKPIKPILKYPFVKLGKFFNGYTKGDFIVVGGRKTSGKSSFILHNYVTSPIIQKLDNSTKDEYKVETPVRVVHINTKRSIKVTLERLLINYFSFRQGGCKVGVSSMFGMNSAETTSVSRALAKSTITLCMNTYAELVNKNFLDVITGKKSVYEIETIIKDIAEEYGYVNDNDDFIYTKEVTIIVSIDDSTGIYTEKTSSSTVSDNGHSIGLKLKELAKYYNVIIVLAVPSIGGAFGRKKDSVHKSNVDEIFPYNMYADRALILHNPAETEEKSMINYLTDDFMDMTTGICYIRILTIVANYMGPSNIALGYFMYPENGFMIELPPASDFAQVDIITRLISADETILKGQKGGKPLISYGYARAAKIREDKRLAEKEEQEYIKEHENNHTVEEEEEE